MLKMLEEFDKENKAKGVEEDESFLSLKKNVEVLRDRYETVAYFFMLWSKPTEEEKLLCQNMIAYTYDKNLLQSMALIKQGKYAYAYDILSELEAFCKKDAFGICQSSVVDKNMAICKQGIYDNHIDITNRALKVGDIKVAADFVQNTYDYFQRNREAIADTDSFDEVVNKVVNSYLAQAKLMKEARNNEARTDLLAKARELSGMVGGKYEEAVLKQIASIQGTVAPSDAKLDSIENIAQNKGYSLDYPEYIKDTTSIATEQVSQIEKDYIPSSENKLPKESVAVATTKVKTIDKAIDDKFYETRTYMQVNNYEKALEVLEKANRLAKIEGDKKAVEAMYKRAIREITAKRMSAAEYARAHRARPSSPVRNPVGNEDGRAARGQLPRRGYYRDGAGDHRPGRRQVSGSVRGRAEERLHRLRPAQEHRPDGAASGSLRHPLRQVVSGELPP